MRIIIISRLSVSVAESYRFAEPINQQVHYIAEELSKTHKVDVITMEQYAGKNEVQALIEYKARLKDYDVVIDFSDSKWVTQSKEELKLNLLLPMHHLQGYQSPPPLQYPCLLGTSNWHAMDLSYRFGMPVRALPYGFKMTEPPESKSRDYMLFFGRCIKERGLHEVIALCRKRRYNLLVAGDDINVHQPYVHEQLKKCDGTLIRWFGAVSEDTKRELIVNAKALIVPYLSDSDASTCDTIKVATLLHTPIFALNRGAVKEFVKNGINGYVFDKFEELYDVNFEHIDQLTFAIDFSIENTCRKLELLIDECIKMPW